MPLAEMLFNFLFSGLGKLVVAFQCLATIYRGWATTHHDSYTNRLNDFITRSASLQTGLGMLNDTAFTAYGNRNG